MSYRAVSARTQYSDSDPEDIELDGPIHRPRKRPRHPIMRFVCFLKDTALMIPVLLVLSIVAMDVYTMLLVSIPAKYHTSPFTSTIFGILFSIDIFLLVWSYLKCVFTSSKVADNPPPAAIVQAISLPRCAKCNEYKPDRAHHCSMCGTCVLKMDHHCPWVANCVGYYNHKYFVLFLFYTVVGSYIYVINEIPTIYGIMMGKRGRNRDLAVDVWGQAVPETITLLSGILTFSFALALTFFSSFHIWMVFKNTTTLEVGERVTKLAENQMISHKLSNKHP